MRCEIKVEIIQMLIHLRKSGFSEESIATGIHVSQATVSKIICGKVKTIKYEAKIKLKSIFDQYCKPPMFK